MPGLIEKKNTILPPIVSMSDKLEPVTEKWMKRMDYLIGTRGIVLQRRS
jgi:hypothetical protein